MRPKALCGWIGTSAAGCSCATACARVATLRLLQNISASYSGIFLCNVVDDVSLQGFGPSAGIVDQLPSAEQSLSQSFRELQLPVHVKKRKYLASSADLAGW